MKIILTESQFKKLILKEDDSNKGVSYGVKGGILKIKKNYGGGNRIDVCFGEKECKIYEILVDPIIGSNKNINFKNLYKKSNGDLVFNRWVSGGKTEPKVIPKSDIYTHLIKPFKYGVSEIKYDISPLGDLLFKKVS